MDGVGLDINNLVKVTERRNMELAMRLVSNLASERVFYTDLNGLQVSITFKTLSGLASITIQR